MYIKSYFATVDHAVLNDVLARRLADRRLLALLRGLIAHGAESPGTGMPIGNLTSQMFANLYLDPLDHFIREELRVRHCLRYMDDFVLLVGSREEAWDRYAAIERFISHRLRLRLHPRRTVVAPLAQPRDVLGYVHRRGGALRIRRRSVQRLWRRLAVIEEGFRDGEVSWSTVRASVASWFGLACHADALALSRAIFECRDVRNIGKRLLVERSADGSRGRPAS